MAGEAIVNGASHPEAVNPRPAGRRGVDSEVNDLILKLKSLELEKFDLLRENGETKERVGELMAEIQKLRSGEADKEVARLRRAVGEKGRIIQGLEREAEDIKVGRAESDAKARELERKIGAFESRETAFTREKSMAKKEGRAKVEEKERVISGLREKVGDLEARLAKVASALRSSEKETGAADIVSWESKSKAKEMESKLVELQRKLEHEEKVITGLQDKTAETINGRRAIYDGIKEKRSKVQGPIVAAGSAGAIVVAAAVAYVRYSIRQS